MKQRLAGWKFSRMKGPSKVLISEFTTLSPSRYKNRLETLLRQLKLCMGVCVYLCGGYVWMHSVCVCVCVCVCVHMLMYDVAESMRERQQTDKGSTSREETGTAAHVESYSVNGIPLFCWNHCLFFKAQLLSLFYLLTTRLAMSCLCWVCSYWLTLQCKLLQVAWIRQLPKCCFAGQFSKA